MTARHSLCIAALAALFVGTSGGAGDPPKSRAHPDLHGSRAHPHSHGPPFAAPDVQEETVRFGKSWFSKVRRISPPGGEIGDRAASADLGVSIIDVVISLYNDPSGDDDPNNDAGGEEQTAYEEIIRFWANAVCEETNEALRLGKVRIFRNGTLGSLADVVWNASEWPRASVSGFGRLGRSIIFGDVFPDGCLPGCDINFLSSARREDAGYVLGHEFGHYVLGVYDEYVIDDPNEMRIFFPQAGDTAVVPSIMNSTWNATPNAFEWLNHSTSNNYEANTAQGRVFGASAWEVLIQDTDNDPKDGDRSTLPQRVRFTELIGEEPTAADNWIVVGLPGSQANCRAELEIIWMSDDIELQLVIDRSFSMNGTPLANAKQAAKTLVDEVENGATALGVVAFNDNVDQVQPIIPIPDPPGGVKDAIKAVIDLLVAAGNTAMFDAADLAIDNLSAYGTTNATNASQLVFLLSDGLDNSSSETQSTVTAAYQAADVPLNTFAYGMFAPAGVLRELAEDTGGLFRASPTDLAEIQSAFLSVIAAQTSSAAIVQEVATVPAIGSTSFPFAVDSTLEEFSIFANYTGGAGDVDFSVSGPSGPIPAVSFACTEVAGATSCSAVVDEATISANGTGNWAVIASNTTVSAIDVNVDILANPFSVRTFDLVVEPVGGADVVFPQPIVVTATVSKELPITGVVVTGTIRHPLGFTTPLTLVDDGTGGDGFAGDGTYSAIASYAMNGIHTIQVNVDNSAMTAEFTTESFQPTHFFPTQSEAGGFPEAAPQPPIDENFSRTSTVQVVVSDFSAKDHPDAAPGTPVTPDNSDIPGIINFSGDRDVFSIPTAGFSTLVLRVTDLAMGMEPRLRVLAENGVRELASATIDDLGAGASYLYLLVPVGTNNTLHGEVTHRTGGTGTYSFSAGTRIVSDNTPPTVECPAPSVEECNTLGGSDLTLVAEVGDTDGDALEVTWEVDGSVVQVDSIPSGDPPVSLNLFDFFALGDHTVKITVADGRAPEVSCETSVTVVDTTGPMITVGDLIEIGPPNHSYHHFELEDCVVSIVDICDGPLDITAVSVITSIYSDEPEDANGGGDGHTSDDILILGPTSFDLRAERQGGGNGRVYGITFVATDSAGNGTTATCFVGVPHSQNGDPPIDDGPGSGYTVTP